MSATKKRNATDMSEEDASLLEENEKLKEEVKQLKNEVQQLKADLAEYEAEESDEDDDEDSVCDGSTWSVRYFQLKQYKQENGHCKVPQKTPQLGKWVDSQRSRFKSKELGQGKIDKLNKLGFYWGKGHPEPPTWEDRFREIKNYHETFGHCNVHVDSNAMTPLAKWTVEQRKQGRRLQKMKPSELTMDQYKQLDALGFKWKTPKPRRS